MKPEEAFAKGSRFPTSWTAVITDNIPVREQKTGNARTTIDELIAMKGRNP